MGTIINISQFLLSLSLLIILHEMGHFFPAKWFKTRVEKFYLFFDFAPFKSLWKIKRGETEYGIGWLPLGGYVKISGMVDESMDTEALKEDPKPWEFRSKPAWQRLIIMIGGVTVNFILGFFLFAMILWTFGKAYIPTESLKYGMSYDSVLIDQGFRQGDRILKVGNEPFDRLEPGDFTEAVLLNEVRNISVMRDGKKEIIKLPEDAGDKLSKAQKTAGTLMGPRIHFVVDDLTPGKAAEKAGLEKGDRIIGVNGEPTEYFDEFTAAAKSYADKEIELSVLRGSDTLSKKLTLDANSHIGVQYSQEGYFEFKREMYSLGRALPAGVTMGMDFLNKQLKAFGQMFRGKLSVKDNLGSVISIGKLYGSTWDWERFWTLTASLSILLAFMNLLPIPALDGGYVFFLIWEVVTGRKVSDRFMEKAVTVGFFLLLALMVYAFGLDIWRHLL